MAGIYMKHPKTGITYNIRLCQDSHFVATTEISGGLLLLAGLFTRITALWFIGEMTVAILTTKIAVFLGTSPLPLPPALPKTGFWAVLHEIRSDYAQLLCCVFLLLEGPGLRSLDTRLRRLWLPGMRSPKNSTALANG